MFAFVRKTCIELAVIFLISLILLKKKKNRSPALPHAAHSPWSVQETHSDSQARN